MRNYAEERNYRRWEEWTVYPTRLQEIPRGSKRALFYRERTSHRGISTFSELRELRARQVNQEFLDEIGKLQNLEYLDIETLTAADLSPIGELRQLKSLRLSSVRAARDFDALLAPPHLRWLFVEHAKHLVTLDFLEDAHGLWSIGVEGSIDTRQTIDSLAPLEGLQALENLFMASTRLVDKDLTPLSRIPNLKVLQCARFAPKEQFDALRRSKPNLECKWCDRYAIHSRAN